MNNLTVSERTLEKYRGLGQEIQDYRVIIEKYRVELDTQEFNMNHGPSIGSTAQEFKDMFVFGAGASAFCCFGDHKERYENDDWRSPLGYDIFNERYESLCNQYEGVKLAIPEFEIKDNTIEECLERDWNKYSTCYYPELAIRHINIQFYLQKLFQNISKHTVTNYYRKNLYQLFAHQLKNLTTTQANRTPVIVNFNYDTILDQFIDSIFGYKTEDIDNYIDWKNRTVVQFKPHGSCNWGWVFPPETLKKLGAEPGTMLFEQKVKPAQLYYKILGKYEDMVNNYSYGYDKHDKQVGKHSLDKLQIEIIDEQPAYPAMLLPFKEKDEFVMPYHHQTALEFVMPHVERLFVIGWKGSEQLFLNQLEKATKIKEVIIVNPEFDIVKSHLASHIKSDCGWTHIQDFEALIKKEMI